jgi:hypothetical protein
MERSRSELRELELNSKFTDDEACTIPPVGDGGEVNKWPTNGKRAGTDIDISHRVLVYEMKGKSKNLRAPDHDIIDHIDLPSSCATCLPSSNLSTLFK